MTYYCFQKKERITLPKKANDPAIIEILHNYTPSTQWEIAFSDDENHITVGAPIPTDREDFEYVISVGESGIYIEGGCYKDTVRGFVSLMEQIFCYGKGDYRAECGILRDSARVGMRAVHLCFFPDFSVEEMRKVIRTCGMGTS